MTIFRKAPRPVHELSVTGHVYAGNVAGYSTDLRFSERALLNRTELRRKWQITFPGELVSVAFVQRSNVLQQHVQVYSDRSMRLRYLSPNMMILVCRRNTGVESCSVDFVAIASLPYRKAFHSQHFCKLVPARYMGCSEWCFPDPRPSFGCDDTMQCTVVAHFAPAVASLCALPDDFDTCPEALMGNSAMVLGCTVLILVFVSENFSRKTGNCYERQKKVYFHLVIHTVPLLISLGAQYLCEGLCIGYLAKTFIVLTCWGFVSVGTCIADVHSAGCIQVSKCHSNMPQCVVSSPG